MELQNVRVDSSDSGRVRLTGRVRYDSAPAFHEDFWFDVPEAYAAELSTTGNPWLACLAPLAVTLQEPLRIDLPVDRLLARNVRELMSIWSVWYPNLKAVPLRLAVIDPVEDARPRRTAAFFSGGVDSFYTVLRHRDEDDRAIRVDDLILVRGFDFPLENEDAFERHRQRMELAAGQLGMGLVAVATNLRETRLREASWSALYHGSALCAVGLAMERRYRHLLIASTSQYGELLPYGSHPLTDALHSTSSTRVLHDGAQASRLDKIRFVAGSDLALRFLHVCFREVSERNCGRCRKCLLAWMGLWLCGAGDRAVTFPSGAPDLRRVRRILVTKISQQGMRRLAQMAETKGRSDVVRAIRVALARSAALGPILALLDRCRRARVRGLSYWAGRMRRTLFSGVVR